jgi:PAS domain S-box-containing protein
MRDMNGSRLLLVDDNDLSLKLMKVIFETAGFETTEATDGGEAITILLRERVDLIITDVLMPNVDGYYLCYKIRMNERLRNIPIIVYSGTFTSQSEEAVAKDMGADLFIRKPAPKNVLIEAVGELLSNPTRNHHEPMLKASASEVMLQYNSSLIDKLEQRNFMLEEAKQQLEQTVEERTKDLKNTNDELSAVNEELQAANEELTTMNEQLSLASEVINKQAQIIISQKDELLKRVYDTVVDILFVLDVQETGRIKITSVNKAFEMATGITGEEVNGKWMDEVTPARLFQSMLGKFQEAIRERKTVKWEEKVHSIKGKLIGEVSVAPVMDENGNCSQLIGAVHDITERKEFEIRLASNESRLREAQSIGRIGNWEIDFMSKNQDWSDEVYRIYGIEKGEIAPSVEVFLSLIHPEDAQEVKKIVENAFTNRSASSFYFRFIRKGGEVRHGYSASRFEYDELGTPVRLYGIIQDITEKVQAEEKIRENEKRYRETLDSMIEGCQIIDFDWRYVYVNPSAARQGQSTCEFLVGKTMMEAYPGIEHSKLFSILERCMSGRKEERLENEFTMRDGSKGWFDLRVQPSPEGLFILSSDISDRKRAEQLLRDYNERYRIVSKATNDAIWDWDIVNDVEVWNHGMQTIFGYADREIRATKLWWQRKIHPEDYKRVSGDLQKVFESKASNWSSQYRYLCANGSYKNVYDRAFIIYDHDVPIRMIGAMQDITEVVQYREGLERMVEERTRKLNQALKKEKELVEMKSKFVSMASHEFRTPLSTIVLSTGFIKKYKKRLDARVLDEKLEGIEKQVNHMTYLLDDVLTIGKAEAGKIEVALSMIKIGFLRRLAEEVMRTMGSHKLRFTQYCKLSSFQSSEKLIRNIVINLLTNAVKFSPGRKEVFMSVTCDEQNLIIQVRDLGLGIPARDRKNLFSSFARGSNVSTIEGTGLGLSIVKKAVDLLQGSIRVKSQLKKGTEFRVVLPLKHE